MTVCSRDVHLACESLARRRLQECKQYQQPAYITLDDSTCAVVTLRECTALSDFPEYHTSDIITLPLSGRIDLTAKTMIEPEDSFMFYPPAVYEQHEVQRPYAAWDWRTGRIVRTDGDLSQVWEDFQIQETPTKERKPRRRHSQWCSQLILATSLRALANKRTDCVIYCRKVQKLGLESDKMLRSHFEQFGSVDEVLLSNAHTKSAETRGPIRIRPSGIALVVMSKPEDVTAILDGGETQIVNGVQIFVRRFEDRSEEEGTKLQDEGDKASDAGSTTIPGSEGFGSERLGPDDSEC